MNTTTGRELDRAIDRLTDAMTEYAMARVTQALSMERDRTDAEIAELRENVAQLGSRCSTLAEHVAALYDKPGDLHSVRVEP